MDIAPLLSHFLETLGRTLRATCREFDAQALERLCAYAWPGNVRELRNVVERILVLHGREPVLTADMLPEEFQPDDLPSGVSSASPAAGLETMQAPPLSPGWTLEDAVGAYERQLISEALRRCQGVQTRTAACLGTTRRILRYKMEKHGICDTEAVKSPSGQKRKAGART